MINFRIEDIGYFKYKNSNSLLVDCIKEYPITSEIKEYLEKYFENIEIEIKENSPVKIEGKLIALI